MTPAILWEVVRVQVCTRGLLAAVVRRSVGFWGGEIKESVGLWLLVVRTLYWLLPLLDCLLGSSVRVSRLHAG